uniref:Protection of telomeres protein 1 n=1 Tax=Sinocyclocheilus grahami TaxID=75366 RepID=A0A672RDN5_SINGR
MLLQKVNVSSDLDAEVPSHLQRTSITSLTMTSDPSHRCVKARVVHKGPVISCAKKDGIEMLGAEIREEDPLQRTAEHTSINVIFFGTLAKDFSQSARQGVVLKFFEVLKKPYFLLLYLLPFGCAPSSSEAKYTYVPLNKLKPKTVVNVYGVVTFFKQPFSSKGSVIFRVGDIIRLHRFKVRRFDLFINSSGILKVVTFDGTIDNPVVPRSSSKSFHFGESDNRTVQELRRWAANQSWISYDLTVSLSSVKPGMYFDLTCQLVAKAVMDSRCILLKVWDGTKCQHPLLNVAVASDTLEGEFTVAKDRMNLTANILVYDSHLEAARDLKPGMFLRFYNLHALVALWSHKPEHPSFHLHGGTSYGRGSRSLPAESPDLQSLKSVLEKHVDLDECDVNNGTLLEIWYMPPEALVRTCEHNTRWLTVAQPQQLYQCLKLFCSNCKTIKDVPDDSAVAKVFRESVKDNQPCDELWAATSSASSREPGRTISMHISRDMVGESTYMQLIFVEGTTLDEICVLSRDYKNLVPVRSLNGVHLCLCHTALGVQQMQFRLLIQFDLEDQTDTLEALLWENAERFFHVSAVDASGSPDLQDKIQTIMDTIQPPYSSLEECPWLDLCLSVYPVKDSDRNKVCYQITNTEIREE